MSDTPPPAAPVVTDYDLMALCTRFLDKCEARQFADVDAELVAADVTTLEPVWMVSLLRYSFAFRRHLPNWIGLRDRIAAEMSARGFDAHRTLRGLLEVGA